MSKVRKIDQLERKILKKSNKRYENWKAVGD